MMGFEIRNHISVWENLARTEFSDRLQISMNIKDIAIPLIIHYYLLRHSEHYTSLSTLNHNVRFLPCQHRGRWHIHNTCTR